MEKRVSEIKSLYEKYIKRVSGFLKETCGDDVLQIISWLKYMDNFNKNNDTSLRKQNIDYNVLENIYGLSSILDEDSAYYRLYFVYDVLKNIGINVYFIEGTMKDELSTSSSALLVEIDKKIYCYKDDLEQLMALKLNIKNRKIVFDMQDDNKYQMEFDITLFSYMNNLTEKELADIIGSIYKYKTLNRNLRRTYLGSIEEKISSLFLMNLTKLGIEIRKTYEKEFVNKEFKK